jgi:hypothetical protein
MPDGTEGTQMARIAWQLRLGDQLIEEVDTMREGLRALIRYQDETRVRCDDGYVVPRRDEPRLMVIFVRYRNGILVEIGGRTLEEVIAEDYPDGDMTVEELRRAWTA